VGCVDKRLIVGIVIVILILIVAGFAVMNSNNDKIIINGNFNLVGDSQIDWNDTTHEYKVFQNFASNDDRSYDTLKVTLAFYKDGNLIGTNDTVVTGDSFKDFSVNTTTKLPQKPDGFTFDIHTI
jgi:hypothetical protein